MGSGSQGRRIKWNTIAIVAAAICAAAMWFYVNQILVPYQRVEAETHGRPRGNLSDLYPRWYGARELLLHHRNPYAADVTREIQMGYYGRVLDSARKSDPRDKQGFAYPIYVAFLLSPTLILPFEIVAIAFKAGLVVITIASVILWLQVLNWRLQRSELLTVVLLVTGSFPVVQGLKLQQLSLLVAGIIAAACALLVSGHLVASGVLLATATIKPQLVLPIASVLLVWTVGDWRRRQRLFWSFAGSLLVLLVASELVLPGWFRDFLSATSDYRKYAGGMSMLQVLLTKGWGKGLSAIAAAVVAVVAWRFRKEVAGSDSFAFMIAITLAITVIIIPMFAPYNYVLMLPGLLLVTREWRVLWGHGVVSRIGLALTAVAVAWPWLACMGLAIACLVLSRGAVQQGWWLPLYTSAKVPMPLVALIPLSLLGNMAWREALRPAVVAEPLGSGR